MSSYQKKRRELPLGFSEHVLLPSSELKIKEAATAGKEGKANLIFKENRK